MKTTAQKDFQARCKANCNDSGIIVILWTLPVAFALATLVSHFAA